MSPPSPPPPTTPSDDDVVDMDIFGQILDLDEPDNNEFSQGMVTQFYSQAKTTFKELDEAYANKDVVVLAARGHFLKGSSAALGLRQVQEVCEKIQLYGQLREPQTDKAVSESVALDHIGPLLVTVKAKYREAEIWLKDYYHDTSPSIFPEADKVEEEARATKVKDDPPSSPLRESSKELPVRSPAAAAVVP